HGAPLRVGGTQQVAQLTGPGSPNRTDERWHVYGTDLGHLFTHDGRLYVVFGDTFGPTFGSDWRSNTMAWTSDRDPRDGLTLEGMITGPDGRARELLASQKVFEVEATVIPTYGVSVAGRMFLHYMSVRHWGPPGRWDTNHSGLAYSDDAGHTWVKDPAAVWPAASNFAQVAMVRDSGYVYLFGIPAGRFGGVRLARLPVAAMLRPDAYEYWDGSTWSRGGELGAATIVPAPVGELSVRWSAFHRRWLMLYLNEQRHAIVVRAAERLTGPWSDEGVVATAAQYPTLYAPYLMPAAPDGPDVYFTMSRFDVYNVFLMRTRLLTVPLPAL
ncbi:MAG: DUF4185 domain-containing protein, partial [Actinomycetota bacterium]|nr:DUF4185 domain-containing protein [Actinomycetota bacterium]